MTYSEHDEKFDARGSNLKSRSFKPETVDRGDTKCDGHENHKMFIHFLHHKHQQTIKHRVMSRFRSTLKIHCLSCWLFCLIYPICKYPNSFRYLLDTYPNISNSQTPLRAWRTAKYSNFNSQIDEKSSSLYMYCTCIVHVWICTIRVIKQVSRK